MSYVIETILECIFYLLLGYIVGHFIISPLANAKEPAMVKILNLDNKTSAGIYVPCPVHPQKENLYDISDLSSFLNEQQSIRKQ